MPPEFQVSDRVFLKVSPTKGIRRFGVGGKLSPRYVGPYEIIEKLNPVAYRLDLPVALEHIHNVFHIPQVRKYIPEPDHVLITEPIEVTKDVTYEEHQFKY